jgi:hypothetical protein
MIIGRVQGGESVRLRARLPLGVIRYRRIPRRCRIMESTHPMSLSGVKRTWPTAVQMSAYDPKRTLALPALLLNPIR